MRETDFLVIGSGIAGLTFALKCAKEFPDRKVLVITKATADETNTKYAQGGIAVVSDTIQDSLEQHVQDTLIAGDGLCDEKMVRLKYRDWETDRKSTRLNSSHLKLSRMPSSA